MGRISALDTEINSPQENLPGTITVRISGLDEADLRNHILEGFRTRVLYRIRVYRRSGGLFHVLGDQMLFEAHPVQEGLWDPFSSSWEVRFHDGRREYYPEWDIFFRNLSRLSDFPIPEFRGGTRYVLAQARLRKMVFREPLNVLSLFPNRNTLLSPWRRYDIP